MYNTYRFRLFLWRKVTVSLDDMEKIFHHWSFLFTKILNYCNIFKKKNANIKHALRDWKPDKMFDFGIQFQLIIAKCQVEGTGWNPGFRTYSTYRRVWGGTEQRLIHISLCLFLVPVSDKSLAISVNRKHVCCIYLLY